MTLAYWTNDDGDGYILVDEATQDVAGQYLADEWGLLVVASGRGQFDLKDCECYPLTDDCPDNEGRPCHVRERADCWSFESYDPNLTGWTDATAFLAHDDEIRAWWPKGVVPDAVAELLKDPDEPLPVTVAPGQVEAGL